MRQKKSKKKDETQPEMIQQNAISMDNNENSVNLEKESNIQPRTNKRSKKGKQSPQKDNYEELNLPKEAINEVIVQLDLNTTTEIIKNDESNELKSNAKVRESKNKRRKNNKFEQKSKPTINWLEEAETFPDSQKISEKPILKEIVQEVQQVKSLETKKPAFENRYPHNPETEQN